MNRLASFISLIILTSSLTGCFGNDSDSFYNKDDDIESNLRINHVQMKGTHNSYHLKPIGPTIRSYDYSHLSLDMQAENQGVRQFEIDVWWDIRGQLYVYHNQYDSRSNCVTFEECIKTILRWSNNNTDHVPLMIWIEPKEWLEQGADINTIVEIQNIIENIELEISQYWPKNKTITPDDVRGDQGSLSESIINNGWPLLEDSRGKAIFILMAGGKIRENYHQQYPELKDCLMFTMSVEGTSEAAIFSNTDPINDADTIRKLVEQGYIVRSRADNAENGEADNNNHTRLDAALSSGAHSISTDYPGKVDGIEYFVNIPNSNPVACNPITAPEGCTKFMIENLNN